jgi:hypothetical protein
MEYNELAIIPGESLSSGSSIGALTMRPAKKPDPISCKAQDRALEQHPQALPNIEECASISLSTVLLRDYGRGTGTHGHIETVFRNFSILLAHERKGKKGL